MSDQERDMEDQVDATTEDNPDGLRKAAKTIGKTIKKTFVGCAKPDLADKAAPDETYPIKNKNGHQDQRNRGQEDDDVVTVYPLTKRCHVVFACNEFKNRADQRRYGAEADRANLKKIFVENLGFKKVNNEDNELTESNMQDILKDAVENHTKDCDCFVFAISSHGEEKKNPREGGQFDGAVQFVTGEQQGTGKVESHASMFLRDIINKFSECENLKGKPKVFLFQCCRSRDGASDEEKLDSGITVKLETSDKRTGSNKSGDNPDADQATDKVAHLIDAVPMDSTTASGDAADARGKADTTPQPQDARDGSMAYCFHDDCLVMAAVPPKKFAWRHNKDGSWMIHYLKKATEESKGKAVNILQLFTRTAQLMAQRETWSGKKAVPVIEHTLTKDIVVNITPAV